MTVNNHDAIGAEMIEDENWEQTLVALAEQSRMMDVIHDDCPGKENRQKREILLRPHHAECVRLHYRRIEINAMRAKLDAQTATQAVS